jgi:hypothetical protein
MFDDVAKGLIFIGNFCCKDWFNSGLELWHWFNMDMQQLTMRRSLCLMCQVDWRCWWNVYQVQQEVSKLNSIFMRTVFQPANIHTGFRSALYYLFIFCMQHCRIWRHQNVQFGDTILRHFYSELEQQQQIIITVLCDVIFWKRLVRLDITTCSHTVFRNWTQGLYFSQISMDWFLRSVNYLL